jgi:hypothetical protein
MVIEPAPLQAAVRTLSTGAAGTLSERARTLPPLAGAEGAVRRLSGTLSERDAVSVVSRAARDAVSAPAARLSNGARAVVSDGAGAVVSVAGVCADAAGGTISNCETETESARTIPCQYENIGA